MMMMMSMMMGGCFCIVVAVGAFFLFPDVFGMGSTAEESSSGDGTGDTATDCVPVPTKDRAPDEKPQNSASTCNAKCTYGKDLKYYKSDGTSWTLQSDETACKDITVYYSLPTDLVDVGVTLRVQKNYNAVRDTEKRHYLHTSNHISWRKQLNFVGMWSGPGETDSCHIKRTSWKLQKDGNFYTIRQAEKLDPTSKETDKPENSRVLTWNTKTPLKDRVMLDPPSGDNSKWYVLPAIVDKNGGNTRYVFLNVGATLAKKRPMALSMDKDGWVMICSSNAYKNSYGMWYIEKPPTPSSECKIEVNNASLYDGGYGFPFTQ